MYGIMFNCKPKSDWPNGTLCHPLGDSSGELVGGELVTSWVSSKMTNTCGWSSNLVMNPNLLPSKSSNNQENIANDGENDFKPLDLGGFPWLSCKKLGILMMNCWICWVFHDFRWVPQQLPPPGVTAALAVPPGFPRLKPGADFSGDLHG